MDEMEVLDSFKVARVAKFQSFRVTELQNYRVSELQSYRVSKFQSCGGVRSRFRIHHSEFRIYLIPTLSGRKSYAFRREQLGSPRISKGLTSDTASLTRRRRRD